MCWMLTDGRDTVPAEGTQVGGDRRGGGLWRVSDPLHWLIHY